MGLSRRDTIIIAVLINTGLLAVLFITALNTQDDNVSDHPIVTQSLVEAKQPEAVKPQEVPVVAARDEVDLILQQAASSAEESVSDLKGAVTLPVEAVTTVAGEKQDASSSQRNVEVTVKRGDVLAKIARANNTTVEAIMKANKLATSRLMIGQVLKVPVGEKAVAEKAVAVAASVAKESVPAKPKEEAVVAKVKKEDKAVQAVASVDGSFYIVQSGDNPWIIARKHNIQFDDILRLNGLNEDKARNLRVGQKIRIR